MYQIEAKWGISYSEGYAKFSLEELGCESEEQWKELSEDERKEGLQDAVNELPECPAMVLEDYNEI